MGYQTLALKGFSWVGLLRLFIRGSGFLKIAILARLLNPSQFGAYGVAALALGLVEMFTETGINVVLIQEQSDSGVKDRIDTAWLTSIYRGILIFLIIALSSRLIAIFYHSPDSLPILLAISLVPLIRGFINPGIVLFQKQLQFNREFFFRATLTLTEIITSILFVYFTASPLGIAIGLIASALVEVFLSFKVIDLKPKLSFSKDQFNQIIHRGKWITFAGIINYLNLNGPDMVIGRLLGSTSLGIHQMAYRFGYVPIAELGEMSNRVTFPIFVSIAGDTQRALKAYLKNTLGIIVFTLPLCLFLIFFPQLIVTYLLGSNWQLVTPLLPIMGLTVFISTLTAPASSMLLAVKQQRQVFIFNAIRFLGTVTVIIPFVQHYGLIGGAYTLLLGVILAIPYTLYAIKKVL